MKNYDKRVKQTRILLSDYLILKNYAYYAGISMAEALHRLITGLTKSVKPVTLARIPVLTTAQVLAKPTLKAAIGLTNVKLRATVAGRGSSNGFKQV